MDTPFFQHSANHLGHPVRPIPPVYDPQEVIDTIVALAREPQDEVVVGRRGKLASIAGKLIPEQLERGMARRVHSELMEQEETAGATTGSLFTPLSSGTDIRGGWLNGKAKAVKVALIGAGMAVPVAALLVARQRRASSRLAA